MNSSRKTECRMPETGPRAPARTLVAVRAMVPVTQMPPNKAEAILAAPAPPARNWSGGVGRSCCRRPRRRAATRWRPAARMDKASGSTACTLSSENQADAAPAASAECRRSACRWSRAADAAAPTIEASPTAIRKPGQPGRKRRTAMMAPMRQSGDANGGSVERGQRRSPAPATFGTNRAGSGAKLKAERDPSPGWRR